MELSYWGRFDVHAGQWVGGGTELVHRSNSTVPDDSMEAVIDEMPDNQNRARASLLANPDDLDEIIFTDGCA